MLSWKVTLVERRPSFGPDVKLISSLMLPGELSRCGVKALFGCEAAGIDGGSVALAGQDALSQVTADTIVLACGYWARGDDPAPTRAEGVFVVGESAGQWGLLEATRGGH